jgi:prophage antirepressor-like protein
MIEEIKDDNNCIVKAFENNPIAILQEDMNNKKVYYFKATDIGKALQLSNVAVSIQHYDDDERVIRKAYDTANRQQDTMFLTSQGVYRLLYNSKKEIAKKFRKWVGDILDDIIFNNSQELQKQLQEQKKQLEEKEKQLIEQKQINKHLINKPDTESFERKPGYIYIVKDTSKHGHYKIGFANDPVKRVIGLNTSSSTYSLEILVRYYTFDKEFAEKMAHLALQPFRIKQRKEWFYVKNDLELAYMIHTVKNCINYIEKYNIKNYDELNNMDINVENVLLEIVKDNELKKEIKQEILDKIRHNAQRFSNKTGNYKGVNFNKEKNKWRAELKKDYTPTFLGYYETEVDGAKAYNDYALYLNETQNTNYSINEIDGYVPHPRDVSAEYTEHFNENKTSSFNGVSYNSTRKYYVVNIKYNDKTYNLGFHNDEIECAKLYNQQALYFNNHCNTSYELNDIPNYKTVEKNIYQDIQDNKLAKKSSKYHGVMFNKKTNKYRTCIVYNKKQMHLGFFTDEIEAAQTYNKKAQELNDKFNTNYKINEL